MMCLSGRRAAALAACAGTLAVGTAAAQGKVPPGAKEASMELARLSADDQADQAAWTPDKDEEFGRRQKVRRDRAVEIVSQGLLASLEDWDRAALLLQHGQSADDYLLAHVLAVPPGVERLPFGRFMAAATLDRFLQHVGRPQIFTTQSGAPDPSTYQPVEPYDDSMKQSLRGLFDLPPLPRPAAKEERKARGGNAKELRKLLAAADEEPFEDGPAPDWLVRARELVSTGAPKTDKDHATAARLFAKSPVPDDLLMAHVMAMAAAFQGAKDGLELCAETLDRFLLAIGRAQLFGRVPGEDEKTPRAPHDASLHEVVLSTYLGRAARRR